ncbi:membrane protein [Streptomyces kurssanovii]|nr:membrane protein [Streptomyces kurssanovii]
MAAVGEKLPQGRYGRTADERADRKLRIVGAVLGACMLALVGWFGYDYVAGTRISAEVIKFDVMEGADEVQVHLEVRKDAGAAGSCTVRALAEDGAEVGRLDVAIGQEGENRVDEVVKIRTTRQATSAELMGCNAA